MYYSKFTRLTKVYKIDKSHCSLYEAMIIQQKSLIVNLLNLSNIYVRRLLAFKRLEALYMCNSAKKLKVAVFTSFAKSQCCTGYPLIQVEIVSICKSHYMHWLVSQSFNRELFLVLGVWSLQCGCRCRCRCRYRSFCCRCRCRSFCCFCCLCMFHIFFLSFCKIQN